MKYQLPHANKSYGHAKKLRTGTVSQSRGTAEARNRAASARRDHPSASQSLLYFGFSAKRFVMNPSENLSVWMTKAAFGHQNRQKAEPNAAFVSLQRRTRQVVDAPHRAVDSS